MRRTPFLRKRRNEEGLGDQLNMGELKLAVFFTPNCSSSPMNFKMSHSYSFTSFPALM